MSPLFNHIRARILRDGPLSVAQFMEEALGNRDYGYYITRDPLGARGDFITAPEISQVFGELLGMWSASVWESLGRPSLFRWVEMGPGRGTLMADAIRATRRLDGFHAAANIHLIESSPVLQTAQANALSTVGFKDVSWHRDLSQVPEGPVICMANEFFDALPVRQFQKVVSSWRERLVDVTETKDGLRFVLSTAAAKPHFIPDTETIRKTADGGWVETSPTSMRIVHTLADRLVSSGGAAVIIDYGHTQTAPGETLQAVQNHTFGDVLDHPGEQDLTAHVDFDALGRIVLHAGAVKHGPTTQNAYLNAMGLPIRARQLAAAVASVDQGQSIARAIDRLVNPEHMGTLFKVMGISAPNLANLVGFSQSSLPQ